LTGLNVETVFLRVEVTVGTSVHTMSGEKNSQIA
jgi:hypothetical protein